MSKKKRGDEPRRGSSWDGGEPEESERRGELSRHKWFRKRKKGKAGRRSSSDDQADDESDDEDGEDDDDSASLPHAAHVADEGEAVVATAIRLGAWGIASAIDIHDCNPSLIRDAAAIRRFVVELCELIEMKRFGETQVVHFGEDERVAGYSMVQLIETSLISAHFANQTNAVYLDVFSCKPYNPEIVREFSEAFFEGCRSSLQVAIRR